MSPPSRLCSARLLRGLHALIAIGAALVSVVIARLGWDTGSHSILLWGTAASGVILAGAGLFGVARLSNQQLVSAIDQVAACQARSIQSDIRSAAPQAGRGLMALGIVLFTINTVWVGQHQDPVDDDDQWAYLVTAREIHDRGGWLTLVQDLFTGQLAEANRHPLYLALLAIHPTELTGRWLSVVVASSTLGMCLFLANRQYGPLVAGLLAVLLGVNGAWLYHAPRVVCESLLTGLTGLLWLTLTTRPVSSQAGRESPQVPLRAVLHSLLLGGLTGLIYLTKGTGLLVLAGLLGAYLIEVALDRSQWQRRLVLLGGFSIGFLVIAAPLLVRNTIRYGSPTYNVNSYLLWVDTYESPTDLADRMTLLEARSTYLATHSPGNLVQREMSGLAWEAFIGLRTLGPAPWEDARVIPGTLLFGLALWGLCHTRRFPAVVVVLWSGVFWVAMAWYVPIAAGDRFVMPLLIPWLTLAAHGAVRVALLGGPDSGQSLGDSSGKVRWLVAAVALSGVASTVMVLTRTGLWSS